MLNLMNWTKPLMVNGVVYESSMAADEALKDFDGEITIHLNFKTEAKEQPTKAVSEPPKENTVPLYRIEVKQWMTKKGSPDFDFMIKWNNNEPMPMRRMYGEILEETKGMVKMKLHGRAEKDTGTCSHCLRQLTHPVSMFYGIGPICGGHMHMASPEVMEKLGNQEKIFEEADKKLREVEWTGWVIKSAITDKRIVGEIKKNAETA